MKDIDIKSILILIGICSLIGITLQYFFDLYWVTATLLVLAGLLFSGLMMYNEDLDSGGYDYQEGVTDTPEARNGQKRANRIQIIIVLLLLTGAACLSYI